MVINKFLCKRKWSKKEEFFSENHLSVETKPEAYYLLNTRDDNKYKTLGHIKGVNHILPCTVPVKKEALWSLF